MYHILHSKKHCPWVPIYPHPHQCLSSSFLGGFRIIVGEGNGNPVLCSCLENPRDGGAWWAAVSGVALSRTRLKQLSSGSSRIIVILINMKWFFPKASDVKHLFTSLLPIYVSSLKNCLKALFLNEVVLSILYVYWY